MKRETNSFSTGRFVLDNGIRLLVREIHSMPTVCITAYFLGGRRVETAETAGVSLLAQRLITKGAGPYDAQSMAQELEYYGISLTPVRGMDISGLRMKTLSRHFDRGMELFSLSLMNPAFLEGELEKERENQQEEIRKEKDDTLSFNLDMCRQLAFEGHPYGIPRQGTLHTVPGLDRGKVLDYYGSVYGPGAMVVAVAGDIKPEEALAKIGSHFGPFQGSPAQEDPGHVGGPIKNVKEKVETSDKQQVAICIGFKAPDIQSEDYFAFRVLNQVLSGMGSRLFTELRDKLGLAYNVNSSYSGYRDGGIFRAYILTGFSQKEKARQALLEEVDRLRTRLVSYDELVRAKRHHLGLFEIGLQGNSSISARLAHDELMGLGYDFMDNYSEKIKRVTRQKVKRAAEKFLKPQSYAIALLTPATFPKTLQ